jgi:bifunctional non-homologous end joining protein LigD
MPPLQEYRNKRDFKKTREPAPQAKDMPFIEPAFATLQNDAPDGDGWLHEVKFDGYRIQAQISGGEVNLLTRAGLDWTQKFGEAIAAALGRLDCKDAIIDGEIVVLAETGISSFAFLQKDLSERRTPSLRVLRFRSAAYRL